MDQNVPTSAVNPLLARVRIPGETFTLPSGGMFYQDGELSAECLNGEIHVYPMTAIDELVLKSVDKIFSGDAVKEVFSRCVPNVLKPGKLSAKDVDFILVALRKVSYGPTIDITYTHDCENAEQHTYDVPLDTFLRGAKRVNPTTMRAIYSLTLENGQVVQYKPASYDDVIGIYQAQQMEVTGQEQSNETILEGLLNSVSALIDNVDGTSERAMIVEWMKSVPIAWLQIISNGAKDTTDWGVTFEVTIECQDCKNTITVPTPLNPISFFI